MKMDVLDQMISGGSTPGAPTADMASAVVCGNCAAAIDPTTGEVISPPPEEDPMAMMGGAGMSGAGAPPLM